MLSYPKAKEMSIVVSRFCFLWEFVFLWGSERATGLFFWNSSVPPFCNWIIQDQESINQSITRGNQGKNQKSVRNCRFYFMRYIFAWWFHGNEQYCSFFFSLPPLLSFQASAFRKGGGLNHCDIIYLCVFYTFYIYYKILY